MNLEVKEVSGGYGGKLVLDGVTCAIPAGSIVSLVGPNGSGKTTLLKMIGRVLRPSAGAVILDGRDMAGLQSGALARMLALLPQSPHVSAGLTVAELVAYGRFPHRRPFGLLSAHDRQVVDEALALTRLQPLRGRSVQTLSGGERQRAWIAMTLAQQPRLLLLDEPMTFLDICCQLEILELVCQLKRKGGITVVMVLHDLNLAASCSDQMIMLKEGKVRHAGPPAAIMTAENLLDVFEIRARVTLDEHHVPHCVALSSARS